MDKKAKIIVTVVIFISLAISASFSGWAYARVQAADERMISAENDLEKTKINLSKVSNELTKVTNENETLKKDYSEFVKKEKDRKMRLALIQDLKDGYRNALARQLFDDPSLFDNTKFQYGGNEFDAAAIKKWANEKARTLIDGKIKTNKKAINLVALLISKEKEGIMIEKFIRKGDSFDPVMKRVISNSNNDKIITVNFSKPDFYEYFSNPRKKVANIAKNNLKSNNADAGDKQRHEFSEVNETGAVFFQSEQAQTDEDDDEDVISMEENLLFDKLMKQYPNGYCSECAVSFDEEMGNTVIK